MRIKKYIHRLIAVAMLTSCLLASAAFAKTSITFNGKTIHSSGGNITLRNRTVIVDAEGTVIVNGEVLSGNILEGSGESATEERELGDFNRIQLDVSADVTVTTGKKPHYKITADDNILPLILSRVSGNTLRISSQESFSSSRRIKIAIAVPRITSAEIQGSGNIDIKDVMKGQIDLAVSGSGNIEVKDVMKDQIDLVISGSGNITVSGEVARLKATINGSGDLHAGGLKSATTTITVNGSGDANVHIIDALTANVRGSGNITYTGSPSKVHTSVKGSGHINKK